jgi:hypothetical protein
VVLLGQQHRLCSRHPHRERAILHLHGAIHVPFVAAHRVGGAQDAERRRFQLIVSARLSQGRCALSQREGLIGLLGPQRRPRPCDESLDLVSAVQLGDQLDQLRIGP